MPPSRSGPRIPARELMVGVGPGNSGAVRVPVPELIAQPGDEWPAPPASVAADANPVSQPEAAKLATPVVLFLVTLFIPWEFWIGTFALSAYRLVLLVTTLPCVFLWLRGKAGKIRIADIAVMLFWAWSTISFVALDGLDSLQSIGILFVETIGPYLLARCYIRDADSYRRMVQLLFWLVVLILPFAIFEAMTGYDLLLDLFATVMRSHPYWTMPSRWGFHRVQSVFEHTILFGVVVGSIFAMVYTTLGYGETVGRRLIRTAVVGFTAFLSFSAGPISALTVQGIMLIWNALLNGNPLKWKLFIGGIVLSYVLVSLVSNQTVPEFYLTHFSFDAESANFRILIWDYGSASALKHPLFGVGFGEWERPSWMPPSIDMFWLIFAVQRGIPAAILMLVAFASAFVAVGLGAVHDERANAYRQGYMFMMTGFFIVGWTVDFWNATYVLFMFLLGSGFWLLEPAPPRRPT